MEVNWQIIVGILCGGLAGGLASIILNIRTRFWDRYHALEKMVFENPFLYPIWDTAGDPNTVNGIERQSSSFTLWIGAIPWMNSLDVDEKRKQAIMFIEMWGDFQIEANTKIARHIRDNSYPAMSPRAIEIAKAYDIFPRDKKMFLSQYPQCSCHKCRNNPVPDGRNGVGYSKRSFKRMGFGNVRW